MVRGSLALLLILLLPSALALCQTRVYTPGDALINTVYSPTGINYGTDLTSPEPVESVPVERNEAVIVNPADNTYTVVDLPAQAMAPDAPTFASNKAAVGGPFFIAGILDDTLRVAKDVEGGHGYGLALHDRYEGRAEVDNPASGISELAAIVSTMMNILSQPRIVNVLRADSFTVEITCASSACDKRMYSLFTRYMNLGASVEMFTEWIGQGLYNYTIPRIARVGLGAKLAKTRLAEKITGSSTWQKLMEMKLKVSKALRFWSPENMLDDAMRKLDDQSKAVMADALTQGETFNIRRILVGKTPLDFRDYIASLPYERRQNLDIVLSATEIKLREAKRYIQKGDYLNARETIKGITKYFGDERLRAFGIIKKLDEAIHNISVLREAVEETLPATTTLSGVVRDWMALEVSKRTEKGRWLLREWIAPLVYYIAKRGPGLPIEYPPGVAQPVGLANFISMGWYVVGSYPIPAEWRRILMYPADSARFSDAFVDFIINKGVDPGDAFKSFVSITPLCLVNKSMEAMQGQGLGFFEALCVTQKSNRIYSSRTAIFGIGVASPDCPTCSVTQRNGKYALTFGGATGSAFLMENSKDDSLIIAFAHHTNIKMGDEAEIDLDKATESGEVCTQKCDLLHNVFTTLGGMVKGPQGVAFVASGIQSLLYVLPLPVAVFVDIALVSPQMEKCHTCVDDLGGYYLHVYSPKLEEGGGIIPSPEKNLSGLVGQFLDALSLDANSVLAKKLRQFEDYLRASEVKRSAVVSNIVLDGASTGELRFSGVLVYWTRADELVPTGLHNQESVDVQTPGGTFSVDTEGGTLSFNGQPIMQGDPVRLYVVNTQVPGIIFPARLVYTEFVGDAFRASSAKDYQFTDPAFVSCVTSAFGCQSIHDCLGDLVEIHTDWGVIRARDQGFDAVGPETYRAALVRVSGYEVYGKVARYVEDENGESLQFETVDESLGELQSMVFQNGFIIRDGSRLVVWVSVLASVSPGAVESVSLDWNSDSQGLDVELVPSPRATPEEREEIERMNQLLDQIGPVRAIDGEQMAVAIVRDDAGNLWLRIYDKENNVPRPDLARNLRELIDTLVALPSTINSMETNTWTLEIYRAADGLHVRFTNKLTGETWDEKLVNVVRDPKDPMAVRLVTDKGEHVLRAYYENGVPYLSLDGLDGQVVGVTGASVTNELIKSVKQDPEDPSKLVVETDKGTHTVEVKVSSDGTPYLSVDGRNAGMVNTIQGTNGFLWFDPTEGWKLVNGALLPLADAFKNGIKISLSSDGIIHGEPSSGVVVLSPSQPGQQGLVLPLFDGWEKVLLTVLLAALAAFTLRERA